MNWGKARISKYYVSKFLVIPIGNLFEEGGQLMPMRALYDAQCSLLRDCERKFGFIQNHASKMNPPDFLILLKQVLQTNVGPCNVFLLASNLTFLGIEWKIGLSPSVKLSPKWPSLRLSPPPLTFQFIPSHISSVLWFVGFPPLESFWVCYRSAESSQAIQGYFPAARRPRPNALSASITLPITPILLLPIFSNLYSYFPPLFNTFLDQDAAPCMSEHI